MKEEIVYLIGRKNTDFVKIGITGNLDSRLTALKSDYKDVELLSYYICPNRKYSANLEKKLHHLLEHKRIQFEWFILTTNEILAINEVVILFHKVKPHLFELMQRKNTWINTRDIDKIFIASHNNAPYFF